MKSLAEFLDVIDSVVIKVFGNSCPMRRKIEMKYKKMLDTIDRELCMTLDDWNAFLTVFATPIQASTDQSLKIDC